MKIDLQFSLFFILLVFEIFCLASNNDGHGIQIITKSNHSFDLNLIELNEIFMQDDIKDRSLVVVSIAGPFRKGKSFLLSFFLRYLNAQVRKFT